jgi:hypothetical protein
MEALATHDELLNRWFPGVLASARKRLTGGTHAHWCSRQAWRRGRRWRRSRSRALRAQMPREYPTRTPHRLPPPRDPPDSGWSTDSRELCGPRRSPRGRLGSASRYQAPGLAWLGRRAEVAEELIARPRARAGRPTGILTSTQRHGGQPHVRTDPHDVLKSKALASAMLGATAHRLWPPDVGNQASVEWAGSGPCWPSRPEPD